MIKIGFIDYYLDEWHANNYPEWIEQASGSRMRVAYAYGQIDAPSGMDNDAWCRYKGVERLSSIAEVVDKSDCLIVLSPDHPEQHEALADLALRSGKPTYVDKTFAPDRAAALRMFEKARQHGTPLYSSSALRFAEEYGRIEQAGIVTISSIGPGKLGNYAVHQIEPIVALMGRDARRVLSIGTARSPALLIEFEGGRQAEIRHMDNSGFGLFVGYASGAFVAAQAQSDFFRGLIRDMVAFFRTGKPTVDPEDTIAIVTLIEHGLKAAQQPYEWVRLP